MAFCYSSFKWTKTPSKHGVFSLWLQTWAHSGDGRALLLLLRSVSLHSLSPAEGEKIPGCDSPLRPTASVQIRKTDVVQRWRRRGSHELVLMYMHAFLLPSSPFSWLLLSGVLRLKPRTFSTVRNGSTPELHPKQSPLFPTFPSITMETTHKSYCFIGHLRGKPSIAIAMQTRPVAEGKSPDGLPSLRSSPSVVRKPLYLCWPKNVLVGNSAH